MIFGSWVILSVFARGIGLLPYILLSLFYLTIFTARFFPWTMSKLLDLSPISITRQSPLTIMIKHTLQITIENNNAIHCKLHQDEFSMMNSGHVALTCSKLNRSIDDCSPCLYSNVFSSLHALCIAKVLARSVTSPNIHPMYNIWPLYVLGGRCIEEYRIRALYGCWCKCTPYHLCR